jgi:hypothetical protein
VTLICTCHLQASVEKYYGLAVMANEWRVADEAAGVQWATTARSSTIAGSIARHVDHTERAVALKGGKVKARLSESDFGQLQDLWCTIDRPYDKLRDMYRTAQRYLHTSQYCHNIVTISTHVITCLNSNKAAQFPEGCKWRPSSRSLTDHEAACLSMTADVVMVKRATLNNIPFATKKSQAGLVRDDSCIKSWYLESDHQQTETPMFARVVSIFEHEMYPGGCKQVVVEGEWLTLLDEKSSTGLTQIESHSPHPWNSSAKYVFLKECAPYNVAFLRQDPHDEACTTFAVIDREGMFD